MLTIKLKKGKDKAARQLHPWIFSGAIDCIIGKPADGDLITVIDEGEKFLAVGYYNSQSRVAVRLLEWDPEINVDELWWKTRIQQAVDARKHLLESDDTNTYRLIFSEADYLPGLIVDRFADYLSVQFLTSGIERVKNIVIDELRVLLKPKGIFDRSDISSRAHEGLPEIGGVVWGDAPPEFVEILENGIKYLVNISQGQKSGFYCDQRINRKMLATYAKNKRVLDCFSYSGGFTLNCLQNSPIEVVSVDSSKLAIETLQKNIILNGFNPELLTVIQADVNKQLRQFKESGEKFDVIILDPPKYAPSRSSLVKASRAYKDLNQHAMKLLTQGGLLATFSCSGAVDINLFKQILAWAALDAGKEVQFIAQFSQPEDHPVRASFPEGEYLKGLLCRVM